MGIQFSSSTPQTGDLILFEGEHYWFSELIEFATRSPYSHCGIFYKDSDNVEYLIESAYENIDGTIHWGVQKTPWKYIKESYDGKIFIRRLSPNLDRTKLDEVFQTVQGKPYDANIFHFLRAYFGIAVGNCKETHSFFCSALVSYLYCHLDILPQETKWDLVSPNMLSEINPLQPFSFSTVQEI